ncbi:MAG: sulfite exporter TauE/SafE family protein [Stappiaceae bacterium]
MLSSIADFTSLPPESLLICGGVAFIAGIVRGFAGFALSALLMAGLVSVIPPVQLIPICVLMEAVASIAMFRGGLRDADMTIVWGLAIGTVIGTPIGLLATTTLDIDVSKTIALIIIIALTVAQIFKFKPRFVETKTGLYGSGITSGVVGGLAAVGGMVVALYVLAKDAEAKTMRGSLVMYLIFSVLTMLVFLLVYEMLDMRAIRRALFIAPLVVIGVFLGGLLFRPSLIGFYRRFCLFLLLFLSSFGLVRLFWFG